MVYAFNKLKSQKNVSCLIVTLGIWCIFVTNSFIVE